MYVLHPQCTSSAQITLLRTSMPREWTVGAVTVELGRPFKSCMVRTKNVF